MGLLIGIGNTKPSFPHDNYYGVEWDTSVANPEITRIGEMTLHASLPIQSGMRRCLLKDDGTVNYYLHATDSTKKADGTAAVLDGTDGQVMVEIPAHYRKFEMDGTIMRCFLAEGELPGFHLVPKAYRSAYHAAVDRTNTSAPKLASVVNLTAAFRGGANNASYDGTYRSMLGTPSGTISLTNYRAYARNRGAAGKNGAGWNCDVYEIQKTCFWLFVVEYVNFNSQAAFNAEPTAEGYKQGGLGDGPTDINSSNWSSFNSYNPFIPCGHTNSLGNQTGVVAFPTPSGSPQTMATNAVSYRGLENPFGHIFSWTDGVKIRVQSNAGGGLSEVYVCTDPAKFNDSGYTDYEKRGEMARAYDYIKALIVGEFGENIASDCTGASATTYICDRLYGSTPSTGEAERGVLFGGNAAIGAAAGFACAYTLGTASNTYADFGSRLCFIPE